MLNVILKNRDLSYILNIKNIEISYICEIKLVKLHDLSHICFTCFATVC